MKSPPSCVRVVEFVAVAVVVVCAGAGCVNGEGPADEACVADEDCVEDEVCVDNACFGAAVCSLDAPCADGFACRTRGTVSFCARITGTLTPGAACTGDDDCDSGACLADVCVATCTLDSVCAEGTRCVLDGARRVCATPSADLDDGAVCTDADACQSGTCVRVPPATDAVCAPACDAAHACIVGFCAPLDDGARACVVPAPDGAACVDAAFCAGGRCIGDGDSAVCASACIDGACADNFVCVDDSDGNPVCMPQRHAFDDEVACVDARDCASHICGRFVAAGLDVSLCASPCPADGCPVDQICWEAEGEAADLCGPPPP